MITSHYFKVIISYFSHYFKYFAAKNHIILYYTVLVAVYNVDYSNVDYNRMD